MSTHHHFFHQFSVVHLEWFNVTFSPRGQTWGGAAGVFCPLSANTKEAERQRRARWWKAAPQASSASPDDWLMFKRSGSIRSSGSSFINVIFGSRGWRERGRADFCQSLAEIHASQCDALHSLIFHISWINVHLFPLSGAALTLCLLHTDEICLPKLQFCLFKLNCEDEKT